MREAPYYVWRRSDGYVSATRYKPQDTSTSSFEILGVHEEWEPAREQILKARDADGDPA